MRHLEATLLQLEGKPEEAIARFKQIEDLQVAHRPSLLHTQTNRLAAPSDDVLIIVSGLPRSGTSLMMQMLQAAGIKVVSDSKRTADESNPRGYLPTSTYNNIVNGANNYMGFSTERDGSILYGLLEYRIDLSNPKTAHVDFLNSYIETSGSSLDIAAAVRS